MSDISMLFTPLAMIIEGSHARIATEKDEEEHAEVCSQHSMYRQRGRGDELVQMTYLTQYNKSMTLYRRDTH